MKQFAIGVALAAMGSGAQAMVLLSENFDNVAGLTGWINQNQSAPVGVSTWFQGNLATFPGHVGGYAAANFQSTGTLGTISSWLITPALMVENGNLLSFWTRTVDFPAFPDRLEVRMSTVGNDLGTGPNDVGDFSTLLLSINPTLTVTGYPEEWTQYTIEVTGLSGPTPAKFGFRYYVPDAGLSGTNSDYIGIDSLIIQTPEPGTLAAVAFGLAALARRRARK